MLLHDSKRAILPLGKLLASRGEGSVYEVDDARNLVAKVYHKPTPERAEKLTAMTTVRSERLLRLAAWPVDTLWSSDNRQVVGFLMPKVAHAAEVHELYGLKSRQKTFPQANWLFLIQAAANTARAFHAIHEHGHVVGDVNHGNMLVSPQATVTLIDCDSFQINTGTRTYLCPVGVDTHTPPELQGVSFAQTARTSNHDAFGLAVLIFQLLFSGRHPFSGTPLDPGDMPIEKAIRECRFAYGSGAGQRRMRQPPGTLELSSVTPRMADLFDRAFLQGGAGQMRPTAADWVVALEELRTHLRSCTSNSLHHHRSDAVVCPWCQLEQTTGLTFFLPTQNATPVAEALLSLETIWNRVVAVPAPLPAPPLPAPPQLSASPEYAALAAKRSNWLHRIVHGLAITKARHDAGQRLEVQRALLADVEQRWHKDEGYATFRTVKASLSDFRAKYLALNTERDQKLQELQNNGKRQQLKRHLESIVIRSGIISGIGPSKVAALQSYGIATAEDVSQYKVLGVPGFGPSLTQRMLDWRGQMERNFRYDPNKGTDPRDVASVDAQINRQRTAILDEMRGQLAQLNQVSPQIQARRVGLQRTVQEVLTAIAQAEADLQALS